MSYNSNIHIDIVNSMGVNAVYNQPNFILAMETG